MKKTVSGNDISEALGIDGRSVRRRADKEGWFYITKTGRGGTHKLYITKKLPQDVRLALAKGNIGESLGIGKELAAQLAQDKEKEQIKREEQLALFATLPQKKQDVAHARDAVLRAWKEGLSAVPEMTKKEGTKEFCRMYAAGEFDIPETVKKHIKKVSWTTLYRWSLLREEGLYALAPGWNNPNKGTSKVPTDQQELIIALLKKTPHISGSMLQLSLETRFAKPAAKSTVRNFVKNWKEKNASLYLWLTDRDGWKNKYQFAVGDASEYVERLNQVWEFDSTPADLLLADGRYSLIGVIDVYTRRLKLIVSKTSKASAVAALLRAALLDWGVCEVAKTDNGADYVSNHITGVFAELGIEQALCPPFTPENKPHIERVFKTFSHSFMELMPGYIGHSVADRKAIESRKSFADRLGAKDETVEVRLSAEELQNYCDRWCRAIYEQNPHSELDGRTPDQVARAWKGTERRISNERALDLLLAEPVKGNPRKVTKKGLTIDKRKYIAEAMPMAGEWVNVKVDPADWGTIYLYGAETGEFLCVAYDHMRVGQDRTEIAAKLKNRQKVLRAEGVKKVNKIAREQAVDEIEKEIMEAREAKVANIINLPKPSEEYTSPGLEQAAKAVEAMDTEQQNRTGQDAVFEDALIRHDQIKKEEEQKGKKVMKLFATETDWFKHLQACCNRGEYPKGIPYTDAERLKRYYATTVGRNVLMTMGDLIKEYGVLEKSYNIKAM